MPTSSTDSLSAPVRTRWIRLERPVYFRLLLEMTFRKYLHVFILLWIALFLMPSDEKWKALKIYTALFALGLPFWLLWRTWRFVRNPANEKIYSPRRYTIDSAGWEVHTESGEYARFGWDRIVRIKRVGNALLLYVGPNQFLYFPPDAFERPQDAEAFARLMRKYAGKGRG